MQTPTSRRATRDLSASSAVVASRISVNHATTFLGSLESEVSRLTQIGFGGIGVLRRSFAGRDEQREAVRQLRSAPLLVSSLSCVGGFTGTEGWSWDDAMDDGREALRLAAEIKAKCLVVVPGRRGMHTTRHARAIVSEALGRLGDEGKKRGIEIALLPVHRMPAAAWSILDTIDAAIEVVEACNRPNVGLVFDTFHMAFNADLFRRIPELAPRTKLVVLSDAEAPAEHDLDRCLPDDGILPLARMIGELELAGYRGSYELKSFSPRNRPGQADQLLTQSVSVLERLAPTLFGRTHSEGTYAACISQS